MARLKLKRLTRAVYDSSAIDPGEPSSRSRFLPNAATVIVLVCVVGIITGLSLWLGPSPQPAAQSNDHIRDDEAPAQSLNTNSLVSDESSQRDEQMQRDAQRLLIIHVVGKVEAPGVYSLPEGSRIIDAVQAAGGAHSDANLAGINLAQRIHDGEQINIPGPGESASPNAQTLAETPQQTCINLNTASQDELQELDGVGPALSSRIVDYRQQVGSIATVEQLDAVSGIGPAMLEKIRTKACL